jgi:hypothetical protein
MGDRQAGHYQRHGLRGTHQGVTTNDREEYSRAADKSQIKVKEIALYKCAAFARITRREAYVASYYLHGNALVHLCAILPMRSGIARFAMS